MCVKSVIHIYTDGACSGNPGPGGWAIVILEDLNSKTYIAQTGSKKDTTNNEMELTAVINALQYIKNNCVQDIDAHIYMDSAYVYNCFDSEWYIRWRRNGWITASKKPVAHKELWELAIKLWEEIDNIVLHKVDGHSGNYFNEIVDKLAVEARQGVDK